MSKPETVAAPGALRAPARPAFGGQLRWAGLGILAVACAYALPLYQLAVFSVQSDLYSHILLVPVMSAYLAWSKKRQLPPATLPARRLAAGLLLGGTATLAVYAFLRATHTVLTPEDQLALTTSSFLLTAGGAAAWCVGRASLAVFAFPLGMLIFMVPLPTAAMAAVESVMQHGSAAVARVFFDLKGTPVFYHDLNFQIPGISLHVAPECSGLRSTLALTILSLVTGHLFLRSRRSRAVLVLAVLPLALVRNGFRIFTIGELCVHYGPQMIDSFIHRRGGPIFFGLSLVPFFLFAVLLQRRDRLSPTAIVPGGLR